MDRFPSLFISHGAPTLAIDDSAAHDFLRSWGRMLGKPAAIVLLSAHFDLPVATVTSGRAPRTIYDFAGFPAPLYELTYPAPGDPGLAERVALLLEARDATVTRDAGRGFDHGAWVPLLLMYPDCDVPVVQLSIDSRLTTAYHLQLGERLASLRDEGVMIIGSGSATHNLAEFFGGHYDGGPPEWVSDFNEWLFAAVTAGKVDDLLHYRERVRHATRNHPTEEHFMPLLAAIGSAGNLSPCRRVHHSYSNAVLNMDMYEFGH